MNYETSQLVSQLIRKFIVDDAVRVGMAVVADVSGKSAYSYIFRQKNKCVTMLSKHKVKVDEEKVQIDRALLFQRLSIIAVREHPNMTDIMTYEIYTFPPALFKSNREFRDANKACLADAIWKIANATQGECEILCSNYVIDGGWLLQKIPWETKVTYEVVCNVIQNFGKGHIVFDGYSGGPSMKYIVHVKRSKGMQCINIQFTESMSIYDEEARVPEK